MLRSLWLSLNTALILNSSTHLRNCTQKISHQPARRIQHCTQLSTYKKGNSYSLHCLAAGTAAGNYIIITLRLQNQQAFPDNHTQKSGLYFLHKPFPNSSGILGGPLSIHASKLCITSLIYNLTLLYEFIMK